MKFNKIVEMDMGSMLAAALGQAQGGGCPGQEGPIQPDSNIGEFGNENQQQQAEVSVMKDEDGNVKIKTAGVCIKLDPAIIEALKQFTDSEEVPEGDSEESNEGEEDNG